MGGYRRSMGDFSDYQIGIYFNGLLGQTPEFPTAYKDIEALGQSKLDAELLGYVAGGAGDEHTQNENVAALRRIGVWPRMLAGAAERDLSIELFGRTYSSPLYLAPVGVLGACYDHGDLEVAKASAATGVPMIASTLSADTMEDVRDAQGETPGFYQLYTPKDRDLAESLVRRAEATGFAGIVVTLDTWINGWRPRDLDHAYIPMLRGHCIANYTSDPRFAEMVGKDPVENINDSIAAWAGTFGNPLSWDDLEWLRSMTSLPLLLKGICHPEDARRALDNGVDGIICSNHGGRQANGGIAAIDCLPGVVEAAGDAPVLFDSGVRGGEDVVKALALGARAVGLGRPYVWGLSAGGQAGVEHVIKAILAEADLTMAVDGYQSIADLTPAALRRG